MAVSSFAIELVNSFVETDEDVIAFNAGFELTKNPDNNADLGGYIVAGDSRLFVLLDVAEQEGTWLHNRVLGRNGTHVQVDNPAFVLGSIIAVLESKATVGS